MRVAVRIVCSCLVALTACGEDVGSEGISVGDKSGGTEVVRTSIFPMYLIARVEDGEKVSFHDILMLAKTAKCDRVYVEGDSDEPALTAEREKEAAQEGIGIQQAPKECKRVQLKEGTTAQEVIRATQSALCQSIPGIALEISIGAEGIPAEQNVQVMRRVVHWMDANVAIFRGLMNRVELGLPDEWWAIVSNNEDTFLLPPPLQPGKAVILKIPAHLIDTVRPEVLGQPKAGIRIRRIEELGRDEPRAFMELTIPATVWEQAVEGLPVIRLINAQ